MTKHILDFKVAENIPLNLQYHLIKLTLLSGKIPHVEPGQFAQIRVDGGANTFLRRPLSINFIDKEKNELSLLIKIVGAGTRQICALKSGDTLNMILPLGNTFTLPAKKTAEVLLVGGGVGIAPLLMLAEKLNRLGYGRSNILIGARTKNDLLQLSDFQRLGNVFATTEDGSFGEKGFVTQHTLLTSKNFDHIYTCGPTPMMKAVATFANNQKIVCEASLENLMGCGFGSCLCCVTDSIDGNICVCTEGPVFNIKRLKW